MTSPTWGDQTGQNLARPLNAPPTQHLSIGVQPGTPAVFIGRLAVIFGTGANTGLFVYNGTPGLGNPPILAITTASTDPYGNTVTPSTITDAGMPLLIYSGPPASGNLIASIANSTGTDAFGNPYRAGVVSYLAGSATFTELLNGMIVFQDSNLVPVDWSAGAVVVSGTSYLKLGQAALNAPLYLNTSGTLLASHPASTTPETWQTVSVFGANFAAGVPAPRYRLEPVGSAGVVRLAGVVSVTGVTAAAATMFTLAAGYHPLVAQSFVTTNSTGTVAAGSVSVTTGGVVQCAPASAGGDAVFLDGITFPLD